VKGERRRGGWDFVLCPEKKKEKSGSWPHPIHGTSIGSSVFVELMAVSTDHSNAQCRASLSKRNDISTVSSE